MLETRPRPALLRSTTTRVPRAHGHLFITVTFDALGHPFEVFTAVGKGGSEEKANAEAISRLVSLWLRSGGDPEAVVRQLAGIRGDLGAWDNGTYVGSIPAAIAQVLRGSAGEIVGEQASLASTEPHERSNG